MLMILLLMCGIICITISITKLNITPPQTKIVYRYVPKTLAEEETQAPQVSKIFQSMFEEHSPWINSVMDYDRRKQEAVNKYFISQV